jgi:flagellar hook-associated protein 2
LSNVSFLGLNSNFDSANLVNQLVQVETQARINPLKTKKTTLQKERTSLDTAATNIRELTTTLDYNKIKDGTRSLAPKKITSSDSNNEFINVTATNSAIAQTFDVNVTKLASSTKLESAQPIKIDLTSSSLTSSANFKGGVTLTDGTVTINGEKKTFASTADDIAEIEAFLSSFRGVEGIFDTNTGKFELTGVNSLGSAGDTSNMLSALGLNNAQMVSSKVTGIQNLEAVKASTKLSALGVTGTKITINGADISYTPATDTIQTLITKINNSTATKVSASYDAINGRIMMSNRSTGALSITLSSDGNISALNLTNQTLGDNAEFTISTLNGGAPLVSNNNSVEGLIPGVTINLNQVSTEAVKVNIIDDSSGYKTQIEEIIKSVNKLNTFLKNSDTTFSRNMSTRLRNLISSVAGTPGVDKFTSMIDIGFVSNTDKQGNFNGYMLDATRFNKAFSESPDELNKILWGSNETGSIYPALTGNKKGILVQMQELLDTYINPSVPSNGLINKVQESLTSQIKTVDDRIERTQRSIDNMEARMRKQFSQLDVITSQYQQQQSAVSGLISKLG